MILNNDNTKNDLLNRMQPFREFFFFHTVFAVDWWLMVDWLMLIDWCWWAGFGLSDSIGWKIIIKSERQSLFFCISLITLVFSWCLTSRSSFFFFFGVLSIYFSGFHFRVRSLGLVYKNRDIENRIAILSGWKKGGKLLHFFFFCYLKNVH